MDRTGDVGISGNGIADAQPNTKRNSMRPGSKLRLPTQDSKERKQASVVSKEAIKNARTMQELAKVCCWML